jgi:hypothetical protein
MISFQEVVVADFEFSAPSGERPRPVCLVAHELVSGRKIRLFGGELINLRTPPYSIGPDTLFVAYYATAELGCHLALNWPLPNRVLDLFVEFRNRTNGLSPLCGHGLLGAMAYHGLDRIAVSEKDAMRQLASRGGPWTNEEARDLLAYCESDVVGLSQLFERMRPQLDLPRALLRGRYMSAAARIEAYGTPIDTVTLATLRENWAVIKLRLIHKIDVHGIYDGAAFKANRWADLMRAAGVAWPYLQSGRMDLSDEAFRLMAERHSVIVEPYRQLRFLLSQMRLEELAVGADGRNRCLLSVFRSLTGRNQPSNTKFIFGPAVWLRSLIRPTPGHGIAYIDWSQQEFGIAAALSGDPAMLEAYETGDPYLAFAKQAGAAPPEATKETHRNIREQFKACVLGVQYAMGPDTLAQRIGQPPAVARELLRMHRETYPQFWRWSDAAVDRAMLTGSLGTVFGWTVHTGVNPNPRSLRNFPMQANGAEMLRLACCLATEHGIKVCAPVHDALLIEAPVDGLDHAVSATTKAMVEASDVILSGFQLRSDVKLFRYPDCFMDERGREMWGAVSAIINELRPAFCSSSLNSYIYVPPETLNTPNTPNTPNTQRLETAGGGGKEWAMT